LQTYKEKHSAVSLSNPGNNAAARKLTDISAELTRARGERLLKSRSTKRSTPCDLNPGKLATFPAIASSPAIQALMRDVTDLQSQDAVLAADFGEQIPATQGSRGSNRVQDGPAADTDRSCGGVDRP
jgi:uncharacterized protein involved in exopolysaccharide biosynthesis